MDIDSALSAFHDKNGFGPITDPAPSIVSVFVGGLLVPLPNITARRTYLKYHDIHHIITGYGVGRIGEGELSAWELGTGTARYPMIAIMNLVTLSTGFILAPRRAYRAFRSGCQSTNLYAPGIRSAIDRGAFTDVLEIRNSIVDAHRQREAGGLRRIEFCCYIIAALIIHAALVVPSLALRIVTEKVFKLGLIRTVKE